MITTKEALYMERTLILSEAQEKEIASFLSPILAINKITFKLDPSYSREFYSWDVDFFAGDYLFRFSGFPELKILPADLCGVIYKAEWGEQQHYYASLDDQYWNIEQEKDFAGEWLFWRVFRVIESHRNYFDELAKR